MDRTPEDVLDALMSGVGFPSLEDFALMRDAEKANWIGSYLCAQRLELVGGYPDRIEIRNVDGEPSIIIASSDANGMVSLQISTLDAFLEDWGFEALGWIEEENERLERGHVA